MLPFNKFRKIPRLNRDIIITEKIDGTNAQVFIEDIRTITEEYHDFIDEYALGWSGSLFMLAGSRKRWINVDNDNFGFAKFVQKFSPDLFGLGPGVHYGEWWGRGIQRGYGLQTKVFSLFNTHRWGGERPLCCDVVPVLYEGPFSTFTVKQFILHLARVGSPAARKYTGAVHKAEGVVVFHKPSNSLFKVTIENDEVPKSTVKG